MLGNLASHIHKCACFHYHKINLGTVRIQTENRPINFSNCFSLHIKCHTTNVSLLKILAVLPESIVAHTCKSNTFIIICIVHPADFHMTESSADVMSWEHSCKTRDHLVFFFLWTRIFNQLDTAWRCHH